MTVDRTDVHARMKFAKTFLSHKFKGNGLKYEVGVCIRTGEIVWIHGPKRCGMNDIQVARDAFISFLNDDEMAMSIMDIVVYLSISKLRACIIISRGKKWVWQGQHVLVTRQ